MPEQAGPWENYSKPGPGPWANYASSPEASQTRPSQPSRANEGVISAPHGVGDYAARIEGQLRQKAQGGGQLLLSPFTGLARAVKGASALSTSPWQGVKDIAMGAIEASQLPGAFLGGGASSKLIPQTGEGSELATLPVTGAKSVSETGEALGTIKSPRGIISEGSPTGVERSVAPPPAEMETAIKNPGFSGPVEQTAGAQDTINRDVDRLIGSKEEAGRGSRAAGDRIEKLIGKGMGATEPAPNLPIKSGVVPEGHTAINSSAATSWKYNPESQSLDIQRPNGTVYRTGEVTPEEWQHLQETESKGGSIGQELHRLHHNHPVIERAGNPVIPTGPRTFSPNASGQSDASLEAIRRQASEKSAGVERVVVDTRSGQERPLIGPGAVDYQPRPHEKVIFRGGDRDGEIIDQGDKARDGR